MENTRKTAVPPWRRALVRIATVDAIVFIAVFAICLLTDALTWLEYGNGLVLAGAVVIGFGVFSLVGGWGQTRNFNYLFMLESIALSLLPLTAGALLQIAFVTPPV